MADPILEFDPTAEASGSPLTITTGNYGLESISAPAPPPKYQWATSVDTEGSELASRGHENRVITIGLWVTGATALANLTDKITKLHREGGTLKYTSPAGTERIADIKAADAYDPIYDHMHVMGGVTAVSFSLPAKPYLRGAEVDLGDNVETTLPALVFTEATVAGDVPALGRLVVDNDASLDQWWLTWGIQSRYYSSSANAALYYEAEGRTPLGGSSTGAGASSPSGTVIQNTALSTNYQAVMSTQASGGGAHLSHIGSFRVYARCLVLTANAGTVSVALEWGEGDYLRPTTNAATDIPTTPSDVWRLVDMGIVTLRQVHTGTQQWEGRILAKSTSAGDDLYIDYLMLVPLDEGSGIASAVTRSVTPTSYGVIDQFTSTTAGSNLNARVAPTGGTWATSGGATDLQFSDAIGEELVRSVGTDVIGSDGRYALVGSTNYTNVEVSTRIYWTGTYAATAQGRKAIIARWTNSSNYLRGALIHQYTTSLQPLRLEVTQTVSGTAAIITTYSFPTTVLSASTWYTLRLRVLSNGTVYLAIEDSAGTVIRETEGASPIALATGGTLATGLVGLYDFSSAAGMTRYYDDVFAFVPVPDAAVFPSQSLEVRHDRVTRENTAGGVWSTVSSYTGDYLYVPPSGAEARTARMIVKYLRNEPLSGIDSSIDDISAKLFVTPRYLSLPA